jgi:hypothetical protein
MKSILIVTGRITILAKVTYLPSTNAIPQRSSSVLAIGIIKEDATNPA